MKLAEGKADCGAALARRTLLLHGMAPWAYPRGRGKATRPNIIWVAGDDLGVELGCYGHPLVATPHMDRLAREGVRFSQCHSTAPVCSPSRSAYQTGVYQTTTGTQNHRSHRQDGYSLPRPVRLLTDLLREREYFCCNVTEAAPGLRATGKTDFNFRAERPFDGTHWRERPPGSPFFAQVNLQPPHKGPAFAEARRRRPRVDATRVLLPPYCPDHPVVREEVATYLDAVQLADDQVGALCRQLEHEGLLDNTVIFLFGDNGRCLLRSKQWLYEPGTHVPLIVRFPDGRQQGRTRPDLCTLLDMTASTLGVAKVEPPSWMQGQSLFGHSYRRRRAVFTARDRSGIAVDRIRAVRTERYRLIRNDMPERPYAQPNAYIETEYPTLAVLRELHAASRLTPIQAAFLAARKPPLELYDLEADPHEVRNLASSREYAPQVGRLQSLLEAWERETQAEGARPEDPDELRQASRDDAAYRRVN